MSLPAKDFDVCKMAEYFEINKTTGIIAWKKKPAKTSKIKAGDTAGTIHPTGYIFVTLNRRRYLAHRIAWALHYGYAPMQIVDHINGDKHDNRIKNLRLVSRRQNIQNQRLPSKRSSTGHLGVSRFKNGKFRATINIDGKNKHLGSFNTIEEASDAYLTAKAKHHISQTIELERMGLKEAA